ncbi:MAG: LamG domain-containing protein, partial [Anaerolineales bacterium]|nr:LamG domain-containing protein [Anaerolineales bacterium]
MRIDNTGSVGIGTDSPGSELDLGGGYMANEQGRQDHVANTMPAPYYRFDGSNDTLELGTLGGHANVGSGSMAVSYWINPTSLGANHAGLIRMQATSANSRFETAFSNTGSPSTFHIYTNDGVWHDTEITCPLNVWTHVVWTKVDSTLYLYINGVSQWSMGHTASLGDFTDVTFGEHSTFYEGSVSDIKIYNVGLSATEVKQLYSGASVPFKYKGASQTNMITSWTNTNFDTCTTSGPDISSLIGDTGDSCYSVVNFEKGKKYRLTLTTSVYITGVAQVYLTSTDSTTGGQPRHNIITHSGQTWPGAGETDSWEFTAAADYDNIVIVQYNGTNVNLGSITGMSLVQIGAVAEYDGSTMTGNTWHDKSGNNLDGDVEGASLENKVGVLIVDDRVGIGTTSPDSKLEISGSGTDDLLKVGEDMLFVSGSGNVGIGTTSPGKLLTVTGDVSGDAGNMLLVNKNDNDGDTTSIIFGPLDDGTYGKGGVFFERTYLQARGSIHFATNNASTSATVTKADARLTILRDGNVGIGDTSPAHTL